MRGASLKSANFRFRESCPIGQVVADKLREFNAVMRAKSVPSMLHCAMRGVFIPGSGARRRAPKLAQWLQ